MKIGYLLALLCLVPSLALADIYKSIDADGHVTYSSAPIKGGKRVVVTPAGKSISEKPRAGSSPRDFPKVNEETQKGRDGSRRKILEDELKTEESSLDEAKQGLQVADAHRPKDDAKVKSLSKDVDLHQANIDALKTELSKLK